MRGFLGGGFWGLVLGGVTLAGVSLVNPPPNNVNAAPGADGASVADDAVAVEAGDTPEIATPQATSAAPVLPGAEDPVELQAAPETFDAPESDAAPAVDVTQAAPAAASDAPTQDAAEEVVAQATDGSDAATTDLNVTDDAAQVTDTVADLQPAPDETDAPSDIPTADDAPGSADAPAGVAAADTDLRPAAPETAPAVQPTVASVDTLTAPAAAPLTSDVTASADAPVLPSPQSQPLDTPATDVTAIAQSDIADAPTPAPTVVADAPIADDAPATGATVPTIETAADVAPLAPQAPLSPATPAAGDAAPTSDDSGVVSGDVEVVAIVDDTADRALPGGNTGVRVNRLTGGATAAQATDDAPQEAPEAETFPEGTPAITRYAAAYSNPDDLPEMSVVLTDDGSFDGAVAAVAGIPFPVSVMLNPSLEDAQDRMNAYRAVGVEVGMEAALPPSATATDVAIYFEAALAAMPQAIAILDAQGETQGDMDVIQQTVAALSENGQGLITVPRGLNSAPRVAAENGVPAGVIFRDLDAEGQDGSVIRRFMDQAAFRARQDTGVIMLGQVRPETISALIQWGSASRAGQVAVVPVSATLTAE